MGEDRKLGARENRRREGNERGERKERAGGRSSQKGRKVGEITQQHSIVFRSHKGKRGETKKNLASAGKANMESARCSAPFYLVTLGTFCIVTCYIHLKYFFCPFCGSRTATF